MRNFFIYLIISLFLVYIPKEGTCQPTTHMECMSQYRFDGKKLTLTEQEWKKRLTPEQFKVLRKGRTEPPFKNVYFDHKEPGIYQCVGCALPLFSSAAKYDSGTGWPSFWRVICEENVTLIKISNPFSSGKEVICSRCNGHLGELFNDGPPPSGKRYCINSASLKFVPKSHKE